MAEVRDDQLQSACNVKLTQPTSRANTGLQSKLCRATEDACRGCRYAESSLKKVKPRSLLIKRAENPGDEISLKDLGNLVVAQLKHAASGTLSPMIPQSVLVVLKTSQERDLSTFQANLV